MSLQQLNWLFEGYLNIKDQIQTLLTNVDLDCKMLQNIRIFTETDEWIKLLGKV